MWTQTCMEGQGGTGRGQPRGWSDGLGWWAAGEAGGAGPGPWRGRCLPTPPSAFRPLGHEMSFCCLELPVRCRLVLQPWGADRGRCGPAGETPRAPRSGGDASSPSGHAPPGARVPGTAPRASSSPLAPGCRRVPTGDGRWTGALAHALPTPRTRLAHASHTPRTRTHTRTHLHSHVPTHVLTHASQRTHTHVRSISFQGEFVRKIQYRNRSQ